MPAGQQVGGILTAPYNGIDIYITDEGKFQALVDGNIISRANRKALEREIAKRKSSEPLRYVDLRKTVLHERREEPRYGRFARQDTEEEDSTESPITYDKTLTSMETRKTTYSTGVQFRDDKGAIVNYVDKDDFFYDAEALAEYSMIYQKHRAEALKVEEAFQEAITPILEKMRKTTSGNLAQHFNPEPKTVPDAAAAGSE